MSLTSGISRHNTSILLPDLAHLIEARGIRHGRFLVEAMDPSAKAYLDKLTATMEANTAALTAVTIRLDDLVAWRPDLERRLYDRTRHHGHLPLVLGDERLGQEVDSGERGHVGCGSKGGQEAGRPAAAFCSGMLEHGHENHRLCLYAAVGEPPGTRRSR